MGRPSEFSDDAAEAICIEIAEGGTLRSAAAKAKVSVEAIKRWLRADEAFRAQYVQAREDQADAFADTILETALDGELEPNDRRIRVDALKWLAGKRKPKVYGDKVVNEHTGADGGPVAIERIERVIVDPSNSDR